MNRTRAGILSGLAGVAVAGGVFATATDAPARDAGLPPAGKVVATISIPVGYGGFAVGEGAVWAMSDGLSTLTRIDPSTNSVIARIPVEGGGEIAAGDGALWLSNPTNNTVSRIDPKTNEVTASIRVGPKPDVIAVSPGAVWVANAGGPSVSRIDPTTNKVVATIRTSPAQPCCPHMGVGWGGGSVWAGVPRTGFPNLSSVVRINPMTNTITARIRVSDEQCSFIVADRRAVWVAGGHCSGIVTRLDPVTNKQIGIVHGEKSPIGLALAFGSLWVADLDAKRIDRVNVRTGRILARLPVGGSPAHLAAGFGSMWVKDDTGHVLRINPGS